MICGVIFDLDGVLLDSMAIWNDLGARYLRGQGLVPEPGLNTILFSMSMEQGAAYLKAHYPLPQSETEILSGIQTMLRDFYYDEVPAKAGARETLAFLQSQGIPMAAATSSPRAHVTRALERLGLLGYLSAIFTTGEVGKSKHQPDIYHWQRMRCIPPRQRRWYARIPSTLCVPPRRRATPRWACTTPTASRTKRACGMRRRSISHR